MLVATADVVNDCPIVLKLATVVELMGAYGQLYNLNASELGG